MHRRRRGRRRDRRARAAGAARGHPRRRAGARSTWLARKVWGRAHPGRRAVGLRRSARRSSSSASSPCTATRARGGDRRGRRPRRGRSASRSTRRSARRWRGSGATVARGVFGADMQVSLVNDGPVTLVLDTPLSAPRPQMRGKSTSGSLRRGAFPTHLSGRRPRRDAQVAISPRCGRVLLTVRPMRHIRTTLLATTAARRRRRGVHERRHGRPAARPHRDQHGQRHLGAGRTARPPGRGRSPSTG